MSQILLKRLFYVFVIYANLIRINIFKIFLIRVLHDRETSVKNEKIKKIMLDCLLYYLV